MKTLILGAVLGCAVLGAQAAPAKKPTPETYAASVVKQSPFVAAQYGWSSPKDIQALKSKFGSMKRQPSNQLQGDESMMSKSFRAARERFLKVKSAEELEAFLVDLEANYDKTQDNDLRFFAAQLLPLRELRGLVWRSRPIFSQSKITHSVVLTSVKSAVTNVKIFLPTEQWEAGLQYVSEPFVRDGVVASEFKSEADLVAHFAGPVREAVLLAAQRVQAIDLKDKYIVWDNKLLFGKASFQDDIDRYRLVGEVERLSALASLHGTLAQIAYQRAYSAENAVKLTQEIGRLYGVDGFLFSQVDGAPSQKRVEILRKPAYRNFGTLLPDGAKWMELSLQHLQETVRLTSAIWSQIKTEDRPLTEAFLFDSSSARAFERSNDLAIANMEAMVEGRTKIRSGVTGETVLVDLPAFYRNPPQDLKEFLPTKFKGGGEWRTVQLTDGAGKVHSVRARNYEVGRGIDWKSDVYQSIFPELGSGQDIPKNVRVLSQSWGAWMTALPLADAIE